MLASYARHQGCRASGKGQAMVDLRSGNQEGGPANPPLTQTEHSICPHGGHCCSSVHTGCGCKCHMVEALQNLSVHQICTSLKVQVDFICDCKRSVGCQMEPWMALSDMEVIEIASVGISSIEYSPGATNGMSTLSRSSKRRRRGKMLALASVLRHSSSC